MYIEKDKAKVYLNESVYVTSIIPQGLPPPNHVGARGGTKTGSLKAKYIKFSSGGGGS